MIFLNPLVNCMMHTTCKKTENLIKDLLWSIDQNTNFATTFYESGEAAAVLDSQTLWALHYCLENENAAARKARSDAVVAEYEAAIKRNKEKKRKSCSTTPKRGKSKRWGVKLQPLSDDEDDQTRVGNVKRKWTDGDGGVSEKYVKAEKNDSHWNETSSTKRSEGCTLEG